MSPPRYAELQVTSHFSFLRGASSCEELFEVATAMGIEALGIVDRNSLAGIVRAHEAAKATGIRLIVGCRLDLRGGPSLLVYPTDRAAYSRLCRLLSLGKRRGGKGKCELSWLDLVAYNEGLLAVLVPDKADDECALYLRRMREVFGNRAYMALTLRRRPNDQLRLHELANLCAVHQVRSVVTNDVLFHIPAKRILQDVITSIRHNVTIDELGYRRERHADRYLKPPEEMQRLFTRYPEALARSIEIMERCTFSLDELTYQYPEERLDQALTPQQTLEKLTWEGAAWRYPEGIPEETRATLLHELRLIDKLKYAPYFLTVHSIVRFARSKDILCQGRGSAANSAVCYVLGITSIDPARNDLLFERFISEERHEPPDIDVDFEHERREIVMQWIFDSYGRDHAALCSTVIRYRTKGAIRDVGKALGLPEDLITILSSQVWGWSKEGIDEAQLKRLNLNLSDRRLKMTLDIANELIGAPRHLSQHPGGFVLTNDRLDDLVPIEPAAMENRQVIEWDKDDIDSLKFMKVDVLALGMLTCMKRAFDLLLAHKAIGLDLANVPAEDPRTYAMIRKADTVGTFQIESRAQMSMLPRMKPRTFYDLVVQVAIVRPGPIQGDMVHPYLRRREGLEPIEFPTPELEQVLGKTLGIPLFQEQAMRVAIVCAGFTPGEADQLRKSMATFKFSGGVSKFRDKLVDGMVANGYARDYAERTFRQLEGFGSYGFPESHAASFALIAYASSWIKCWHPDVFCAALLNSQPMGFYAPAQIVRDAQQHGVEIRPTCINASRWDCTLEPTSDEARFAVRLGLRMIRGVANIHAAKIIAARTEKLFESVDDMWQRTGIPSTALVRLAEADAFRPSLGLARREALWAITALRDEPLALFAAAAARDQKAVDEVVEPVVMLKSMPNGREVIEDYSHVGLTLRSHPMSFLRDGLSRRHIATCQMATEARNGKRLEVAGLVLVRQRPGSAKGVMFITIEDETGIANLVIWPAIFEQYRPIVMSATTIAVQGFVQREGEVVHFIVGRIADLSSELATIALSDTAIPAQQRRWDKASPEKESGLRSATAPKPSSTYIPDQHINKLRFKSRNFH
ncbi:error-prone DNA polymerase [Acidocella aminolytica]|uniref:Error-prone DNA polymerase n=1 Tax=Acidocella aminolytica 101 = DSM 11237 TaxID=1120923 RepID=A0A0D6PJQ5_9PROT|nr:error-prone DNA polymerase [Acidocella aminolytica]GAN81433.1 DNA polymerase III alpha subunit [Acidocella aminolytica 101 = DSM 11237]GBQ32422.1 DNA polymerase III subunit alpha [Acidocella aminolytica 101 = DSM 11237]SHF57037.1 error-prone DNA polymerase [Acidocella aminolytica 101 = DSM 11237]